MGYVSGEVHGGLGDGVWCFFGNFIAVCSCDEKRGVNDGSSSLNRVMMNLLIHYENN